jgi:hypothetical protein
MTLPNSTPSSQARCNSRGSSCHSPGIGEFPVVPLSTLRDTNNTSGHKTHNSQLDIHQRDSSSVGKPRAKLHKNYLLRGVFIHKYALHRAATCGMASKSVLKVELRLLSCTGWTAALQSALTAVQLPDIESINLFPKEMHKITLSCRKDGHHAQILHRTTGRKPTIGPWGS